MSRPPERNKGKWLEMPNGIWVEVVTAPPQVAKDWMAKNLHNRPLKKNEIVTIARNHATGMWQDNGEPIQFDVNDNLINGQNRLSAQIMADATVTYLVVRDLPVGAQDTLDIGKVRTLSDILALRGHNDTNLLGSVARLAMMFEMGARTGSGLISPSKPDMAEYTETNIAELREAMKVCRRANSTGLPGGAAMGMCYYEARKMDPQDAETFFLDQYCDGLGLREGDPAQILRRRLMWDKGRGFNPSNPDLIGFTLRSWNLFRKGERIQRLQPPKGGWTNSTIPDPA